jgi:uncharacterized integral membrane protein
VYLVLIVLAVVVIFTAQNAEVVEVRFLFWTGSFSRALLLFLVFVGGMVSGWLLSEFTHARRGHGDR